MGMAFGITEDDLTAVLTAHGVELDSGRQSAAWQVILGQDARIEKAALRGDDIDSQTEGAYAEIADILREACFLPRVMDLRAEVRDDEERFHISLDLADWLREGPAAQILALAADNWETGPAADEIAYFYESSVPALADMLAACEATANTAKPIGFRCEVKSQEGVMAWLMQHRQGVALQILDTPDLDEEVAEWVGEHYRHNFDAMRSEDKAAWRGRYHAAHHEVEYHPEQGLETSSRVPAAGPGR